MKRVALLFAAVTIAMTWPIARHIATVAVPHQDVYFNMWRLHWFAHAVQTQPAHLFDGNIFYPERGTFALSDAMLVEDVVALPLVLLRVPPVLVQNLLILFPIAASGLAMFALARYLTGSRGAGILAGIVFACAPYRFDHLAHMELQWTMWMPLAFLALHRALDTGGWKNGLAVGTAMALQMLSCIYYGIFLATLLAPAALLLAMADRGVPWKRAAAPLLAGGVLALAVSAAYAVPFMRQHAQVGDRSVEAVDSFSATPSSYLSVPQENAVYGNPLRPGRSERRLFPGSIVVLLAIAGLLLQAPSRRQIVYLLILVAAFEMSLGFGGYLYPVLNRAVSAYRSLRAMGRLGIFVVMALAVLGAYGYAAVVSGRSRGTRAIVCAALAVLLLVEYRTAVVVVPFPNQAPPIYRVLSQLPPGVVAELPAPRASALPGPDPRYVGMSIFHWHSLVNGYSGNYPPSYLARIERLSQFPDQRSLAQLRRDGVRYVIVHESGYTADRVDAIRDALGRSGMAELIVQQDGEGAARLFEVR